MVSQSVLIISWSKVSVLIITCVIECTLIILIKAAIYLFIYIFSIYLLLTNLFLLQPELPYTNSKVCLKPPTQPTKLQNVGIVDKRHLRQNFRLWC